MFDFDSVYRKHPPINHTYTQAALAYSARDRRWHAHVVARHALKDAAAGAAAAAVCRAGVYWGRLALPATGEFAGRVALSASDVLASSEAALAYPSVAVADGGTVWVGFSFWGPKHAPGAGYARVPPGGAAFEPLAHVARRGVGAIGDAGGPGVAWGARTSADADGEAAFLCAPYAAGGRAFGAWIARVDAAALTAALRPKTEAAALLAPGYVAGRTHERVAAFSAQQGGGSASAPRDCRAGGGAAGGGNGGCAS